MLPRILLSIFLSTIIFMAKSQPYYLFTGTYTTGSSEGIYVFSFDPLTGEVTPVDTARGIDQPSYLEVTPDGQFLYAVNETGGITPGRISAFSFDKTSGKLKLLNQKPTYGDHPCYVTISSNRKWVIAANYSGGNLAAYRVNEDGSLSDTYQVIQHEGKGPNAERQDAPHVHSAVITPDNKFLLVQDLGIDKIMVYRFNPEADKDPLSPAKSPYMATQPGGGPRHIAFHPGKQWLYLMEEMGGAVTGYRYKNGKLKQFTRVDAHPPGYTGSRGSADIHVSPDGKFLYASNRFEANNIAIFSIHPGNGSLTSVGYQDVIGNFPRNFVIDPSGNWLLVANQKSDDIRIFRINKETGLLTPSENSILVGNPVCLKFLETQQ